MNERTSSLPHPSRVDLSTKTPPLIWKYIGPRHFWLVILLSILASSTFAQDRTIAARINSAAISHEEVDKTIASQLLPLQQQIYALRKTALENLISQQLIRNEAQRLGISIDLLKQRWMSGPEEIDPDQVEQRYQQNVSAFASMNPDEAKEKLRMDMEGQLKLKRYRDRILLLRSAAKIEMRLEEPRFPPNRRSSFAASGPDSAKVIISEFSDFQCHYCKSAQPTLKRILQTFPKEVRLEYKHLPLEIHGFSFQAAQAANCAGKQGSFWRMHDALFGTEMLSDVIIQDLARSLQLDPVAFDQCLESKDTRRDVLADIEEANRFGVQGTPTLIVNGRPFRGNLTFETLKAAIESELRSLSSNLSTVAPITTSPREGDQ